MVLFKLVLLTGSIYHFLEIYVLFKEWISCSHPWDNDANSTQHPTWRQAVSEEFDSAVYDLLMGLWCFGASKYWGKSMYNYVVYHNFISHLLNKGKHPEWGGVRREISCWNQAEESDAEGWGFRRLMPASDLPPHTPRRAGVFLLYRTYLWNKQVMSINLTMWSTMQYHVVVDPVVFYVVVDPVVFYVIHSQVRYNRVEFHPSSLFEGWLWSMSHIHHSRGSCHISWY